MLPPPKPGGGRTINQLNQIEMKSNCFKEVARLLEERISSWNKCVHEDWVVDYSKDRIDIRSTTESSIHGRILNDVTTINGVYNFTWCVCIDSQNHPYISIF